MLLSFVVQIYRLKYKLCFQETEIGIKKTNTILWYLHSISCFLQLKQNVRDFIKKCSINNDFQLKRIKLNYPISIILNSKHLPENAIKPSPFYLLYATSQTRYRSVCEALDILTNVHIRREYGLSHSKLTSLYMRAVLKDNGIWMQTTQSFLCALRFNLALNILG